jgi:carboxypeptidase family protein
VLVLLALLSFASGDTQTFAVDSTVRGEVTDTSDAVLPGVTVVARTEDGRVVAQTVTDGLGQYELRSLPPGLLKLSFTLDGFESSVVSLILRPGDKSRLVERLKLAKVTEDVVVYGKLPSGPPEPVVFEREPAPAVVPLAREQLDTICRPAKPGSTIGPFGTIISNRQGDGRALYSKGDQVLISGGLDHGLDVGRNVVVIRYFHADRSADKKGTPLMGEHTAGLVQIVNVTSDTARGVVVHTCNEIRQGDLLAAFMPAPSMKLAGSGAPVYNSAARILFADSGQMLGAPGRFMVIDQGTEHGIYAGQRVTLFRKRLESPAPAVLGEAVVIAVKGKSSTIRIERATDAITSGDLAAPQR